MIVCAAAVLGVKLTEQLAGAVESAGLVEVSVQELVANAPPLGLFEAKLTVPVGVVLVPPSVSLTVAVHVVGTPTVAAPQLTAVLVKRLLTVTFVLPLLVPCVLSPPYEAVIVCVPLPTAVGV